MNKNGRMLCILIILLRFDVALVLFLFDRIGMGHPDGHGDNGFPYRLSEPNK